MANRVFAIRVVQWLGWVFETQERKKRNKCSNSGRNESIPQTQSNLSWISGKAEIEISSMKTCLEMWVWESGQKIDPATGLTPVAGPFLTRLGFEKIFKTQQFSKIKERFQVIVNVGVIQVFSREEFNSVGLEKPKEFSKSRDFLGALSGGFTFHGSFSKRTVQIWSTVSNWGGFNEPRRFQIFFCKLTCQLKIVSIFWTSNCNPLHAGRRTKFAPGKSLSISQLSSEFELD